MDARTNKVVWYEGMTLDPQHFQQWDRYHESHLDLRIRGVTRLGWGLARVAVDTDRLANGVVSLRSCRGILPDGMVFDLPAAGPLPAPRPVAEALASTETHIVAHLAIPTPSPSRRLIDRPVREAGVPANGDSEHRSEIVDEQSFVHARYRAAPAAFRDDTTGADEQSIEIARPNAQIRFQGEDLDGYTSLPIARITREDTGFALDPSFVPTVLSLGASPRLQSVAERVLELLVSRSRALTDRQREAASQREFAPSDAIRLSMLTVINTAIPALRHHLQGGADHPADLFQTLSTLAGGLAAVAPNVPAPKDHPTYDHRRPTEPFNALFAMIQDGLQGAQTSDAFRRLPLDQQRETLYVTPLSERDRSATLLLAARSDARTEEHLVQQLPHMFRIASPSTIDQVLGHSVSALRVEPTRRLPPGMPVDERASYFRLLKDGPFWDQIVAEEQMAVFLPSEYADVSLDLIATS